MDADFTDINGINGKQKKGEEVFQAVDWLRRVRTSKLSENVTNF